MKQLCRNASVLSDDIIFRNLVVERNQKNYAMDNADVEDYKKVKRELEELKKALCILTNAVTKGKTNF